MRAVTSESGVSQRFGAHHDARRVGVRGSRPTFGPTNIANPNEQRRVRGMVHAIHPGARIRSPRQSSVRRRWFAARRRPLLRRRAPPHVIGVGARAPAIPAVSRPRCVLSFCTLALVPRRCNLNPRVSYAIRQGVEQDVDTGCRDGRCPIPWCYGQTTIAVNVHSVFPSRRTSTPRSRPSKPTSLQAKLKISLTLHPRLYWLSRYS